MLRVLYVVHSIPEFDKTGTPFVVWRMAKMLRSLFQVEVGFLISSPSNKLMKLTIDSFPIYMLPTIEHPHNFFLDSRSDRRQYLSWVVAAIRDFSPDILHVYNFVGLSYQILRIKSLFPNLKIVRTITHTEDVCINIDPIMLSTSGRMEACSGPYPIDKCVDHFNRDTGTEQAGIRQLFLDHYRQLNAYYENYVDGVIFSGQGFHDYMSGIFSLPARRWLIPYGIPRPALPSVARRNQEAGGLVVIGFFGGFGPRKGLRVVLEAISKRPEIMRSIKLKIVGVIVENWTYKDTVALQQLYPAQVEILGQVDEQQMEETMRTIDIALLPTLFETYNITLRELLLRGTPVIVTDTYGSEKISPGVNGFVFPRGDAEALLTIIERVVEDRSLLTNLQAGAIQTPIETLEEECKKLHSVYQSMIAMNS